MNGWIWFGIVIVAVILILWILLRKKKDNYGMVRAEGSLWNKVKSGCAGCFRRKEKW